MPIVLECPGCGKRYEVESSLAGKKARCKQCGEVFRIPGSDTAETGELVSPERTGQRGTAPAEASRSPSRSASSWESILGDNGVRPAPPTQQPPELYWDVLRNDDADVGSKQKAAKPADYDEFDLPPPPRMAARHKPSTSGKRGSDTSMGVAVSGWFSVALLVLFAGAYGAGAIGLLSRSQARGFISISLALTMIAGGVLILWGTIWLVLVAFREEARCGWMFLFVPFYPLYYIFTRMVETKGPASMIAVAYFVIIGMAVLGPAVDPDRAFAAGNDQAQTIARAEPESAPPLGVGSDQPQATSFPEAGANPMAFGPRRRRATPPPTVGCPGPLQAFLDRIGNQIQAIHGRYGNRAIVFAFTGIPTNSDPAQGATARDVWEAITKQIKELAPAIESQMSYEIDGHRALIVAPIDDPPALANRIDFGRATVKNGTKIVVDVFPYFVANVPRLAPEPTLASHQPNRSEPEIPADADPVTRSLLQLKSSSRKTVSKPRQLSRKSARWPNPP